MTDPFATPTHVASKFPSIASFRGRLVLIQPTQIERDVPKQSSNPTGPKSDRITATVTVVDGKGPVELFDKFTGTGKFQDGPVYRGIWFNQDRLLVALQTEDGSALHKMVLGTIETYRPGQVQGQGNPWGLVDPTEADKDTARAFLAAQMVGGASAPTQAPAPQAAPAAKPTTEAPF